MSTLQTQLKNIPKILPKYAKILEKMELHSVEDLLLNFPFRYDDFSQASPISPEYINQTVTIEGMVTKSKLARVFRRKMTIAEITVEDSSGNSLKAVWFNQPFILESLKEGTPVRLSGKLTLKGKVLQMSNPAWERAGRETTNTGCLVPVYNETRGLTSKWLRWQIKPLLAIAQQMEDVVPYEIRQRLNLYDIYTALTQIHFPDSKEKLLRAQKRFAFQEMFLVQLKTLQIKSLWEGNASVPIAFDEKLIQNFVSGLPFKLTNAQRKASFEILKDLEKPAPMNRLLNGDVGSGKTMVAAIASLQAMQAGFQVVIMAPTEVLAKQHFESFNKIFEKYDFNIALLTNSYKLVSSHQSTVNGNDKVVISQWSTVIKNATAVISQQSTVNNCNAKDDRLPMTDDVILKRDVLLNKIQSGEINLVIGTHAIIQKDVAFKNLALIIIDEQHRFGVAQRAFLQQETMSANDPVKSATGHGASGQKKTIPHLLTMTATPIPRTLAIAMFGSLELSILDEMPKNRKEIVTKIIPATIRQEAYDFIRQQVHEGRQVFVILPLVEDSKVLTEIKAATSEHQRLSSEIFPDLRLGLLHGKLKSKDKEDVMQKFKDREFDILVSTSVVEVGIDIPNASVIVIEDADRFGLSQLHQFRGRVGRGEHQSYCFLFTNSNTDKATERLQAMEDSNDGFEISQKDLELRGPGQFFGLVQSGLPDIAMEHLSNIKLIKFARAEAQNILSSDPDLKKHPLLASALQKFQEKIHLE
ncbi:MAG: ATP-dependent DNA helicase RecG [Candidatus Moranbacteria bacterium]|nr:ATP-dependent DNA helicase RecG [Candidatus Moranbacteria bacterium]